MIKINNKVYKGQSITIAGNKIIIDGNEVTPEELQIQIVVDGNIESIKADACNTISVSGSVGSISTMSGDVEIDGNISGSISTMSGDVDCNNVGGNISTMSGDIKYKK